MSTSWHATFGDGPVVIDGGLSTQLQLLGQDIAGDLWTGRALLDDPSAVTQAHADYIRAGADVVITSSYQVSRRGFLNAGLSSADADSALAASVSAARAAAERTSVHVAASVGPYGAILHDGSEYRGNYGLSRSDLAEFHRERIDALVAAQPDLLAVETIPDVVEAQALVDVLGEFADIPAWMSFTAADGERLWAGQSIEDAVAVATQAPNVIAVGINCTDPTNVDELIARIRAACDLPVIVYPNAGGSWDSANGVWGGLDGEAAPFTDEGIRTWLALGASGIGGCCGTDDRTVSRIATVLGGTRI